MIMLNRQDDEPDAQEGILIAETHATAAYAYAFALCPDVHHELAQVHERHLAAARQPPVEAAGYVAPQLDAWRRAEMQLRLLTAPAQAFAVVAILLRAEDEWLRALHRWLLGVTLGEDRPALCKALLSRQWRNRNRVLGCQQGLRQPSWL